MKALFHILFSFFICLCFAQKQNQEDLRGSETLNPSKISYEKIIAQSLKKLSQNISEEERYAVRMKMADAYLKIARPDFAKSTEMLFKAKEIAENLDDPLLMARIYGSIANQYSFLNYPGKIKPYLDLSKNQVDKLPNGYEKNYLTAQLFIEYGNLEADKENFALAKKNYQKGLTALQKNGNPDKKKIFQYQRIFYNMGVANTYLQKNDSAEYFLNKAIAVRNTENKEFKYFVYNTLAKVYTNRNENKRAADSLESVLDEPDFKDNRLKADMYRQLMASYKKLGDNQKYVAYSEKLLKLDPDVKENSQKAIVTAVNAEQKNLIGQIDEKENDNDILLIICVILILAAVFSILILNKKRKKEKRLYQQYIENLNDKAIQDIQNESAEPKERANSGIPPLVENSILEKLEKFEASNKFTNPKLSVASLAVLFKTNPSYLSETIKKNREKNFNQYINDLRIHYICRKINEDPKYLQYKISYLAEESGFSSHSSFATVFKSVTGISPSAFLREAEKKHFKF